MVNIETEEEKCGSMCRTKVCKKTLNRYNVRVNIKNYASCKESIRKREYFSSRKNVKQITSRRRRKIYENDEFLKYISIFFRNKTGIV